MRLKPFHLLSAACLSSLALVPNVKMNASQKVEIAIPVPLAHGNRHFFAVNPTSLNQQILLLLAAARPGLSRNDAETIARAVITEGNRNQIDPFILLAMIKTESQFRSNVIGLRGERGLMQILPTTAAWMARKMGLSAPFDLRDPATNIQIGAAYLAHLRTMFRKVSVRYVGAYNMGAANVRRLIADDAEPTVYPRKVLGHYREYRSNFSSL